MENWNNLNIYLNNSTLQKEQAQSLSRALVDACIQNDKEQIKQLLLKGAYINSNDEYITPLIASIQNDNSDLAHYLIRAGANINYKPTLNFQDAFWYALSNRKYVFLKMFVDNRCYLEWSEAKSEKETPKTPLIFATLTSDLEAVRILLTHNNIKVNERDGLGNTALHYNLSKNPMTNEDKEIGILLIAAGADDSIINLDGKSPKDAAESFEAQSVLLTAQLDNELPVNEVENSEALEEQGVSHTKGGKLKI